jgi:hypothetical protein
VKRRIDVIPVTLLAGCLFPSLADLSGGADGGLDAPNDTVAPFDGGSSDGDAASDGGDAAANPYVAVVLADQPIAYYRLDETSGTTAHDSSGHGLDATYGSSVVLGVGGLVGSDHAAQFDGSADAGFANFIHMPPTVALEPTMTITVECWVRMVGTQPGPYVSLVSYGNDVQAPFQPWVLQLGSDIPSFYLAHADGGSFAVAPGAASIGATHYLAGTYDGDNVTVYVDGTPTTTKASGPIGHYDTTNGFGIGSGGSGLLPTFSGVIDEIAVYGTALSAQRIGEHMTTGLTAP